MATKTQTDEEKKKEFGQKMGRALLHPMVIKHLKNKPALTFAYTQQIENVTQQSELPEQVEKVYKL